jgi:cadmium resistance protein CadD (predicted permease)
MGDCLLLVFAGVIVFAATNVDDILVLLAFFSDSSFCVREVVLGQYLGIAALTAFSIALSLTALVVPRAYVGLLGLAPLGIGAWQLFHRASEAESEDKMLSSSRASVLAVAAATVANGGDNLGVYVPLFATRHPWEVGVLVVVFLLMTGVWCGVARWLIRHRTLGHPIRTCGRTLLPWVLIALGVYILIESRAFRLISQLG